MNRLMIFFDYRHLPDHLRKVSESCCGLAGSMDEALPESAEKTAGLRKLLEAKDCFVRAALEQHQAAVAMGNAISKAVTDPIK